MPHDPLIVFAMKEESQDLFGGYELLHCGIGKVNAAYHLTRQIGRQRPSMVVNMGTAGSRIHKAGDIINPTQFIQRDMDVTFLGFEKFQTPFSSDPVVLDYGLRIDGFAGGVCGSGDNFDSSEAAADFDVVDMEAYALALICSREEIPFLCLKYVSDGADDEAGGDWNEALKVTAHKLYDALRAINLEGLAQ